MSRGNCYVTSEAVWHLSGGKRSRWTPEYVRHEGDTHWYLRHRVTNEVLDLTASQFKTPPKYFKGRGCGFLTNQPSKRAAVMMSRLVWAA